jgi:signal transduction histidine kinase
VSVHTAPRSVGLMRPLLAGVVLVLTVIAALLAAERVMGAPRQDLEQLALFLSLSGLGSLLVGAAAVAWANRHLGSLRTRLSIAFAAGLLVAVANVFTTSALMFLSAHDLSLLVLLLVFASVISLTFAFVATSALTTNLQALAHLARRLAGGDLHARVHLRGSDEVARLGETLNDMAQRLEQSFERQQTLEAARQDLVVAVSHDLRTPLATTRAMVESLVDGVVAEPAEVRRYLILIGRETQHLSRLIDDLFELSQIESGALQLAIASVDAYELASETVSAYEQAARENGLVLSCRVPPMLPTIAADRVRLARVLRNLVDNALRHTPAGGEVVVTASLAHGGDSVEWQVVDSGPGIPAHDRERIFDRFYRGERSRHRGEGSPERAVGAGLGLAIARGLVEAHAGRIWAEPAAHGGAALCFTIPRAHLPAPVSARSA